MKTNNVPQLRFSGFDDEWEEKKLGEISSKVSKKNTNNSITETFTNSAEFGIISQRDFFDHDISNEENIDGYFIVENDDFVYNPRISTIAPVGPINRNKLGRSGVMSPLYYVFRTHDIDNSFLEKYFKSECWYDFMFLNGNSGARSDRFSITNSVFTQMPIRVPNSEIEQQKIGSFLSHVDSLIQAKTKKLESLKAVKKSLLQKCFPKPGEKAPEMRFTGFSGDWEKKTIGEIAVFSKGHGYSKNDLIPDGDPIILYGRMYTNYETVISNIETFVYKQENSVLSKGGEIIIPASGETAEDIARASVVEKEGIILGGDINIISLPKSVYDSYFVALSISHGETQKELSQNAQGKTIVHLHNDDIRKISILFPSLSEQQKIGQFFSKYDSLISSQQKEIDKLKDIKKSLLQKMFV